MSRGESEGAGGWGGKPLPKQKHASPYERARKFSVAGTSSPTDLTSPVSEKLKNDVFVVQLNGGGHLRGQHHQNTRMFLFGPGAWPGGGGGLSPVSDPGQRFQKG